MLTLTAGGTNYYALYEGISYLQWCVGLGLNVRHDVVHAGEHLGAMAGEGLLFV